MYELRPYQIEASDAVFSEWKSNKSTLLVIATGLGKTIIAADIIDKCIKNGKKVLFLAHREELLSQAIDKLKKARDVDAELEKGSTHADKSANCIVASIQSMYRENRLNSYDKNAFDVIIVDEAHHIAADTYQKVISYFRDAKLLGMTATAKRADKIDLMNYFDSIAYTASIKDAIESGYLSDIKIETVPIKVDLSEVRTLHGDFDPNELSSALKPYLQKVAEKLKTIKDTRKTLVFMPLISIAKEFKEICDRNGISAKEVHGTSPDRKEILESFNKGEFSTLISTMMLTEGYDEPSIDCIINLRPTKSEGLFTQMIGRGTRLFPGKENLLILDFIWQTKKKGFDVLSPIDVFTNEENDKYMKKALKKGGLLSDIIANAKAMREEALIEAMKKKSLSFRGKKITEVDSGYIRYEYDDYGDSFELSRIIFSMPFIGLINPRLSVFEPLGKWEMEPATDKQLKTLISFGLSEQDIKNIPYKGFASKLINACFIRIDHDKCTLKQAKLLNSQGYENVYSFSKEEASDLIDALAESKWRKDRLPMRLKPEYYKKSAKAPIQSREKEKPKKKEKPSILSKSEYEKIKPFIFT